MWPSREVVAAPFFGPRDLGDCFGFCWCTFGCILVWHSPPFRANRLGPEVNPTSKLDVIGVLLRFRTFKYRPDSVQVVRSCDAKVRALPWANRMPLILTLPLVADGPHPLPNCYCIIRNS